MRNSLSTLKSNPASLNSSERAYFFLDPRANRVSSLAVGERQSPRGERGLTSSREERGEIGVFVEGRKGISEFGDGRTFGESSVGDALRVWRDVGNWFGFEHATVFASRANSPTESIVDATHHETRHSLARATAHGNQGEIRQHYEKGMEDQLGALGFIVNTIVLWNAL